MSTLAVILNFCPVYCPHCGLRLRIIDDQQRRMDFFNAGAEESCSGCGARFQFGPYLRGNIAPAQRHSPGGIGPHLRKP